MLMNSKVQKSTRTHIQSSIQIMRFPTLEGFEDGQSIFIRSLLDILLLPKRVFRWLRGASYSKEQCQDCGPVSIPQERKVIRTFPLNKT